jgi:HEPN domain-containing protein
MNAKNNLVKNWLIKAKNDLSAAKSLGHQHGDVAIYHCQQSAKKSIKSFLVFHDQSFPKTHDIRLLVQLAILIEPTFEAYQDIAETLTPYATLFRYPGDLMDPLPEELNVAIENAELVFKFVSQLLEIQLI